MVNSVLVSTALLTLLLAVGLFFFIRASTKDRIEVAKWVADIPETSLLEQLQAYFSGRAYRITSVDAAQNQVTFEGFVRPSLFLAIFLSALAGVGILCLTLVLSFLFSDWATFLPILTLLAPLAGVFYWKKSARPEQVLLRLETQVQPDRPAQSLLTVTAHRDELAELRRSLPLTPVEAE